MQNIWKFVETGVVGQTVAQSLWLFPAIETVHVIALTLVVGSIFVVDLRLLDRSWLNRSVRELSTDILPWTWSSFVVALFTGGLMFTSAATKYAGDTPFRLKMALLIVAGLNMMIFHFFTYRGVAKWHQGVPTPPAAKIAGGLSMLFWIGIVACGRWVGFTTQ